MPSLAGRALLGVLRELRRAVIASGSVVTHLMNSAAALVCLLPLGTM